MRSATHRISSETSTGHALHLPRPPPRWCPWQVAGAETNKVRRLVQTKQDEPWLIPSDTMDPKNRAPMAPPRRRDSRHLQAFLGVLRERDARDELSLVSFRKDVDKTSQTQLFGFTHRTSSRDHKCHKSNS